MKIFYHGDLDGKCSAAIIRYFFEEEGEKIRLFPYDNGRKIPLNKIEDGETVFVLDCCLRPIEEMRDLDFYYNLIWIDHHVTSIAAAKNEDFDPEGIREIEKSACELTWEYVCDKMGLDEEKRRIPLGIQMVGRRDVWDLKFSKDLHAYNFGLSSIDNDPRTERGMKNWSNLVFSRNQENDHYKTIVNDGKAIERYFGCLNKQLMNSYSFSTRIDGLKALAINRQRADSSVFLSKWDDTKYDLMIAFALFKDRKLGFQWKVSLYSDKKEIDVSEIAKKHGGGGHQEAAGFITPNLPFRIENELCTD